MYRLERIKKRFLNIQNVNLHYEKISKSPVFLLKILFLFLSSSKRDKYQTLVENYFYMYINRIIRKLGRTWCYWKKLELANEI